MAYQKGARIIAFTPGFIPFFVMFHLVLAVVRVYGRLVYRIRFRGRFRLEGLRAAVIVSNHTLLFDPGLIAHAISPRRTYFTMLEETALVPWLGTFVRLLGAIPIPGEASSLRILDDAAGTALRTLGFLHFFPEGELYRESQVLQAFQPGAFLVACRHGVPVVPVTTVLHRRLWRGKGDLRVAGHAVRLPPRVTIVIGPPVVPTEEDRRSPARAARRMAERVRQQMQQAIDRRGGCKSMSRGLMPRLGKGPSAAPPEPRTA